MGKGRLSRNAAALGVEGSTGWNVKVMLFTILQRLCLAVSNSTRPRHLRLDLISKSDTLEKEHSARL